MATVKTKTDQEGNKRVILKSGRVSCTCCQPPEACCMYPAFGLSNGLYTASDLPDTLVSSGCLGVAGAIGPLTFTKSGASYFAQDLFYWKYELAFDETGGGFWLFYRRENEDEEWFPIQVEGSGNCLIFEFDQCVTEDQFADTYTITTTFGFPPITVERVSLCRWEAEYINEGFDPPRLQIAYLEIQFGDVSDFFGWYVSYGGEAGYAEPATTELGRLNTPIGGYGNVTNPPPRSIDFTVS